MWGYKQNTWYLKMVKAKVVTRMSRHTSSIPNKVVILPWLLYSNLNCSQSCCWHLHILPWLSIDILYSCKLITSTSKCSWMPLPHSMQLWDSRMTTAKYSQRHQVTKIYFADAGCIDDQTFLYHHIMVYSEWYEKSSEDVELTRHQSGHHWILYQQRRYSLPVSCLLTKWR